MPLLPRRNAAAKWAGASRCCRPSPRAVVERLMSLSQLPAGTWKMHEGDLPHGEAVNLDDERMAGCGRGRAFSTSAVWFRQTIELPATLNGYDLSGARIWFQFHADANGAVPEIIYFNGRRVALGEDLEPEVLFDDARPGDKVVVAVKLLETIDVKSFHGRNAERGFPGEPAESARPGGGVSFGCAADAEPYARRCRGKWTRRRR